jgi:hypothetical protein
VLQLAALLLVALSFLMVARNFPDMRQLREEAQAKTQTTNTAQVKAYVDASNQGERALIKSLTEEDSSAVEPAIKALDDAPRLDNQAGELSDELKALLQRAGSLKTLKTGKARSDEAKKIVSDYDAWKKKRDQWLKEHGDKYGIELVDIDESKGENK